MGRKRRARKDANKEAAQSTEPIGSFPSGLAMAAARALREIVEAAAAARKERSRASCLPRLRES